MFIYVCMCKFLDYKSSGYVFSVKECRVWSNWFVKETFIYRKPSNLTVVEYLHYISTQEKSEEQMQNWKNVLVYLKVAGGRVAISLFFIVMTKKLNRRWLSSLSTQEKSEEQMQNRKHVLYLTMAGGRGRFHYFP